MEPAGPAWPALRSGDAERARARADIAGTVCNGDDDAQATAPRDRRDQPGRAGEPDTPLQADGLERSRAQDQVADARDASPSSRARDAHDAPGQFAGRDGDPDSAAQRTERGL